MKKQDSNDSSDEFLQEINMPMEALEDDYGDQDEFQDSLRITLEQEDGTEIPCEAMGLFRVGDGQYMALYRLDLDNGQVDIVPYEEDAEGNVRFREFVDEDEYEDAAAEFDRLFNEEIKEDMEDEEDE